MPHGPLAEGNREGRRATLRDGHEALTVLFESDILKASFAEESPVCRTILPLISEAEEAALFRRKITYERMQKDGHKFRILAAETLGHERAAIIIDHLKDRDRNGIVKSKTVVDWDRSLSPDVAL